MNDTTECCDNCYFMRLGLDKKPQCLRRAPQPYNTMVFYFGELLREVGWNTRMLANLEKPDERDELNTEVTEADDHAVWPAVEPDDWCGEWRQKLERPK